MRNLLREAMLPMSLGPLTFQRAISCGAGPPRFRWQKLACKMQPMQARLLVWLGSGNMLIQSDSTIHLLRAGSLTAGPLQRLRRCAEPAYSAVKTIRCQAWASLQDAQPTSFDKASITDKPLTAPRKNA